MKTIIECCALAILALTWSACASSTARGPIVIATRTQAAATAQQAWLFVSPPQRPGAAISGRAFVALCAQLDAWPVGVAATSYLENADWTIQLLTDDEQRDCFARMRRVGLQLALGVSVLKDWCQSADDCFWHTKFMWDRMLANGAPLALLNADEPITAVKTKIAAGDMAYAIGQMQRWVGLVRAAYPSLRINEEEAYPANTRNELLTVAAQVTTIDALTIDYDWRLDVAAMADDLATIERATHPRLFGLLLWPDVDDATSDADTAQAMVTSGRLFAQHGLYADVYGFTSWNTHPAMMTPETDATTFSGALRVLLDDATMHVARQAR